MRRTDQTTEEDAAAIRFHRNALAREQNEARAWLHSHGKLAYAAAVRNLRSYRLWQRAAECAAVLP